jgi:hypothetical protein
MTTLRRLAPVLAVLLLAPVCAEFSSGYLPSTGKPLELLGELLFFAPLYGGAALLVRETTVRLGGGWPTRVLLAAAFGLAMPGLIDLSLFTTVRDDVEGWQQIFTPTYVDALGTSLGAVTTWTMGHVVLSICGPIAVVETLTGRADVVRERWLRIPGLVVAVLAFAAVAAAVNDSQRGSYVIEVSTTQLVVVSRLVLGLIALGVVWARALPTRTRGSGRLRPWSAAGLVLGGAVITFAGDASATSWGFLVGCWVVLALAAGALLRAGMRPDWSIRHTGLLAVGALASRALTAFASPAPEGVSDVGKLGQNVGFTLVVALLLVLVARRRARS